jgi:hypothetical protein
MNAGRRKFRKNIQYENNSQLHINASSARIPSLALLLATVSLLTFTPPSAPLTQTISSSI